MIFLPFMGKIIALVSAAGIGLVQGALFFGDTGPGETMATRLLIAVPLAMIGGVIFGYNFKRLWFLAGVNAWIPALFIVFSLAELGSGTVEPTELAILAAPLLASIMAGWFGAKLKTIRNFIVLVAALAVGSGALAVVGGYLGISPV